MNDLKESSVYTSPLYNIKFVHKFIIGKEKIECLGFPEIMKKYVKWMDDDFIKSLHEETVRKLNPFRAGHIREKYRPGSDYHLDFSKEQLKNIAEYGYPDAMSLYKPHITIIRLKDNSLAETIAKTISWGEPTHFIVDKLATYTMGESGTCKDLVKEFTLKGE